MVNVFICVVKLHALGCKVPNSALDMVQLWIRQSQKQNQRPEFWFHVVAGSSSAFRLIKVHQFIVWSPHGQEHMGYPVSGVTGTEANRRGKSQESKLPLFKSLNIHKYSILSPSSRHTYSGQLFVPRSDW